MLFFRKKIFSFLIAILTNCVSVYADTILAYYTNISEKPWKVKFLMISGSLNTLSECNQGQECLIGPHSHKDIIYNIGSDTLKGMVVVTDYKGQRKAFNIDQGGIIHPHLSWLTPLEDACPNDIDINTTYDENGKPWIGQDASGGMIFKYPYLCWEGNL